MLAAIEVLPEIARYPLACLETWGGNHLVSTAVDLPGMEGWVHSVPLDADEAGGDLHYLSVCNEGVMSRIVLADVSGHGVSVGANSSTLHRQLRQYINYWDQTELMQAINRAFGQAMPGSRYATAMVLGYYMEPRQLVFTNAGHLAPLWFHAAEGRWQELMESGEDKCRSGLPVGMIPGTTYRQSVMQCCAGDVLVLYTDGITEAENEKGEAIGSERLLEWAREAWSTEPEELGRFLLSRVAEFRAGPPEDDETMLVLRCT
ncbi:MAG: PP2C family protein-serine/threonine phosphatase [Bryobacteraceae bacterium]